MEKGDDPYEILGVSYEATESEIKKAYRKLALKFHPDKQQTDEDRDKAHDIFAKLSSAYETLTDPVKRYDWKLANESKLKRASSTASSGSGTRSSVSSTSSSRSPAPPSQQKRASGSGTGAGARSPEPPSQQKRAAGATAGKGPPPPGRGGGCTPPPPSQNKKRTSTPQPSPGRGGPAPPNAGGRGAQKRTPAPAAPNAGKNVPPQKHAPRTSVQGGPPPQKHAPRTSAQHPPGHKRPSSSGSPTKTQQRDPFSIFENVMKEEFGDEYKTNDHSGWKESKGILGLAKMPNPFKRKSESSKKEFKKLDVNKDKTLTKDELAKYIESHTDLWSMLGLRLDLGVKRCIEIATDVAFMLATGHGERKPLNNQYRGDDKNERRELTEEEFTHFHKKYVLDPKGAYEFFLRTIFTAFDANGDGVLQRGEMDRFLDVFYDADDVFKGKMRLPAKKELRKIVWGRLDKNRDGVMNFYEMRDLLEVAAVVTSSEPSTE